MAMYAEHVNECGDFDRVRGQALGMESEGFIWAVMCLSREGLIGGVRWQPERSSNAYGVYLEYVVFSRKGRLNILKPTLDKMAPEIFRGLSGLLTGN